MPSAAYKVKTEWLKDGCICVNVAADKNFDKDVRDKVCVCAKTNVHEVSELGYWPGVNIRSCRRQGDDTYALAELV